MTKYKLTSDQKWHVSSDEVNIRLAAMVCRSKSAPSYWLSGIG